LTQRTFAIGDIHGDLKQLSKLMSRLPVLTKDDTVVFMGDYLDRGPDSKGVIRYLMRLPAKTPAKIVFLRGNHEDGWLRALGGNWPEFILPVHNGCLQTMESYLDRPISELGSAPESEDWAQLMKGSFFPPDVLEWMEKLEWYYEDKYAIYVHAGLPEIDGRFIHPSEAEGKNKTALLWMRKKKFFKEYAGKPVVIGHTVTSQLPPELSTFTPDDPDDLWAGPAVIGIDTGCGGDGFLTAVEFPSMLVYESRN